MECNKDEAARAKEIAEKKFSVKDITGAKKFALKAQNLFPGLEGIPQMLATLDVYVAAENKINGEADWYGILGVDQRADDDTVRKQYRKLALMLHPDKNKSIGAEGAFKFISEAWTLLSDKSKRASYDQKRNDKMFQKVSKATGGSSTSTGVNGHKSTKSTTPGNKAPKSTARAAAHSSTPPAPSHKPKQNTFWTVCHNCKMQYEYLRVYINHNLLCPNCHEPFMARETAPPPSNNAMPASAAPWHRQNSNHQTANKSTSNTGRSSAASPNVGAGGSAGADANNQNNYQWGPFSRPGGASSAVQAASMVQQAYEKVKREREAAQTELKRREALHKKHLSKKMSGSAGHANPAKRRRGMDDVTTGYSGRNVMDQMGGRAGAAASSGSKLGNPITNGASGISKPSSTRDLSQSEIQSMLMGRARREIRKKLDERRSANVAKPPHSEDGNQNGKAGKEGKDFRPNDRQHDVSKLGRRVDTDCRVNLAAETKESMTINVPDSDFHDFDKDRTERSFEENQIWAVYDDDDGMPRYYAMIHSVISVDPFKMKISWLNSKSNSELGPINWVASGFTKTCGDFRVGRCEMYSSLNSFSHKVRWLKGSRGIICIYPRKGEVWALYRNWSPNWNELTTTEERQKYDMVEVLEDLNEELGITVAPLVKVAGFKTVFHRHLDPRETRRIPREEIFRFSHHVPSYLLTGQETANSPKGCRELDPAATPLELLEVITNVKEEEMMEIDEKGNEATAVGIEKANDNGMAENFSEVNNVEKSCSKDSQGAYTVEKIEETNKDGVVELDPADTPVELLEVMTMVREEDTMDIDEKVIEDHV
ncbi:hypothetical protein UlMin_040024 [Ulmus minor]